MRGTLVVKGLTSVTKKSMPNVNKVLDQPLVIRFSGKMLRNEVKQGLVWSRFVRNGLAEDHIGLVIKSPTNGTEEPCVEFRHYFLFKTSIADLMKIFFASFSNTSNLYLTSLLNKDMVSKDFSGFVKKLFQRSGPLIDVLNLLFLSCGQVASN